jgi:hypothetical protein
MIGSDRASDAALIADAAKPGRQAHLSHQARSFPSSPSDLATLAGPNSSPDIPTSRPRLKLNANFVDWLMGWPVGWTEAAPGATGFDAAAMESWLCRQRQLLESLCAVREVPSRG